MHWQLSRRVLFRFARAPACCSHTCLPARSDHGIAQRIWQLIPTAIAVDECTILALCLYLSRFACIQHARIQPLACIQPLVACFPLARGSFNSSLQTVFVGMPLSSLNANWHTCVYSSASPGWFPFKRLTIFQIFDVVPPFLFLDCGSGVLSPIRSGRGGVCPLRESSTSVVGLSSFSTSLSCVRFGVVGAGVSGVSSMATAHARLLARSCTTIGSTTAWPVAASL